MENSIGKPFKEILTGFEGKAQETWNNVLMTQETSYLKEYRHEGFARGVTYWDGTITPILENGKMKYITEIVAEATERVNGRQQREEQAKIIQSQKELFKRQNDQLEMIIKNISDALQNFDINHKYTRINKSARDVHIHPPTHGKFIGKTRYKYKRVWDYDINGHFKTYEDIPMPRVKRYIALSKSNNKMSILISEMKKLKELANANSQKQGEMFSKKKYSILAVDDDPASLTALFKILELEGYYVKAVASGAEALRELERQEGYNLVILDIMMPEISGYKVLKIIRQRFQPMDLPVLVLTAKVRTEDLQAGFDAGANDYLTKPYGALELKARVRTLIQLKESISGIITTELSFLTAQIKPHFLYNTLNVISALCTSKPQRAKELLYDLADYLRGSFNFENYDGLTSLSGELSRLGPIFLLRRNDLLTGLG